MTDRVIDIAVRLIKAWEGCRLDAYRDVAGYPTQGYGHLLTMDKHIPLEKFPAVTLSLADAWLEDDLKKTLIGVEAALDGHGPWTDNELAALCSLAFNIGLGAFRRSTVRRMLTTVDPPNRPAAADAFRLWNKATVDGQKVVLAGLVARREAERAVFLGGAP